MGIFSSIKNAIFGKKATAASAPAAPGYATPATSAASMVPGMSGTATVSAQSVDVEAVLQRMEEQNGQNLNWRSSIVDLMKLLGIDSSLSNRKELAQELGYSGARDGSAEMNIWLHKATMRELAKNGGKVPASMTD